MPKSAKAKLPAQKSGVGRESGVGRGKAGGSKVSQFKPGNPWAIKKGEVKNPGGRPKLISHAYREWLEYVDEKGISNAAKVAFAQGAKAVTGDTPAAREIRQTTEGDRINIDFSKLTDDQLTRLANGESAAIVLTGGGESGAGTPPPAETPTGD